MSIKVHDQEPSATPDRLQQFYMVCPLEKKIDMLYSFVRTHLKCKILVFVSSCKQVRFLYEAFCKLQPGIPVTCLLGKQSQIRRIALFRDFCSKQYSLMFATDIASRGLDFPLVNWVVQMDCPDNPDTYIHRVGRTARYESDGSSLCFFMEEERESFLPLLSKKKVDMSEIQPSASRLQSIQAKLASVCSQFTEIKYLAQRATVSYIRSLALLPYVDISSVDIGAFTNSMGLPQVPSEVLRLAKFKSKNGESHDSLLINGQSEQEEDSRFRTDSDTGGESSPEEKGTDDIFNVKKSNESRHMQEDMSKHETDSQHLFGRKKQKKKKLLKNVSNTRLVFDEGGQAHPSYEFQSEQHISKDTLAETRQANINRLREKLKRADIDDRARMKELARTKKARLKEKKLPERESADLDGPPRLSSIGDGGRGSSIEDNDDDDNAATDTVDDLEKMALYMLGR